jgi:hypothetical protein
MLVQQICNLSRLRPFIVIPEVAVKLAQRPGRQPGRCEESPQGLGSVLHLGAANPFQMKGGLSLEAQGLALGASLEA